MPLYLVLARYPIQPLKWRDRPHKSPVLARARRPRSAPASCGDRQFRSAHPGQSNAKQSLWRRQTRHAQIGFRIAGRGSDPGGDSRLRAEWQPNHRSRVHRPVKIRPENHRAGRRPPIVIKAGWLNPPAASGSNGRRVPERKHVLPFAGQSRYWRLDSDSANYV